MAKAYLEPTDQSFTANNPNTTIYGQDGQQSIVISQSASNIILDQNIEEILLQKPSTDYTYKQTGNILKLYESNTLILSITVQGDADGTKLIFSNGYAYATLQDSIMKLGGSTSSQTEDANIRVFDQNQVITPLTLKTTTPSNNQSSVPQDSNFTLTFSESVFAESGKYITIKKTNDNSTITTIETTDPQITINGDTVTINPTNNLPTDSGYYILIDKGAFVSSSGSMYEGISSSGAFGFSTPVTYYPDPSPPPAPPADTTAPTLSSSTPIDDATGVAQSANIVLTMSENVTAVTGKNITIKKTSDDSTVATIDAADAQVSVAGSVVTINQAITLGSNTKYYVLVDSGAFKDSANNVYAGISSTTALSFTTTVNPNVSLADIAAGTGGFFINNHEIPYDAYSSASFAGDVNGDGLTDFIVEAYGFDVPSFSWNGGRKCVVFGKSDTVAVNLATIATGTGGFAINAEATFDSSGDAVSSAGDINGDGLADLFVSGYSTASSQGRNYIVFGKSDTVAVNLSNVAAGTGGFVINEEAGIFAGSLFSPAGDVNGDGLGDFIIGAYNENRAYIVFGKTNTTAVNLADIAAGIGGFVIDNEAINVTPFNSISYAGDINGDGLADLIVGTWLHNTMGIMQSARSYIVFGKSNTTAVNLSDIASGIGGFAMQGAGEEVYLSHNYLNVSSAGDINGDGLADVIIGSGGRDMATPADLNDSEGRSYVVFGKSDGATVSLASIVAGTGGFAINGVATDYRSGDSVSTAGDINGDGLADLIINGSYVVFGKSDTAAVNLSTVAMGIGGFKIDGDRLVSNAGDVNGDGLADLMVSQGSYGADEVYIIFGGSQWLTESITGSGTINGTAASEALIGSSSSDTLTGNGGIDRFYAGDGADTIILTPADITNLSDNTTGSPKAVVDGGGDIDTLRLSNGANLDLTVVANQGAAGVEENSRIESIEKIDLATGTAANTLTLTIKDVIDMSGMNLFNSSNGWTGLAASVSKHQIIIEGGATDTLTINEGSGTFTNTGTATYGGNTYNIYENVASNAQVIVLDVVGVVNNDV
ncbi:MAG TPA: Ig-like domain-containing protein [Campylobacterales bacterium]|nr:Ig-like domain-containing protein [Campylobacterales bacterium]